MVAALCRQKVLWICCHGAKVPDTKGCWDPRKGKGQNTAFDMIGECTQLPQMQQGWSSIWDAFRDSNWWCWVKDNGVPRGKLGSLTRLSLDLYTHMCTRTHTHKHTHWYTQELNRRLTSTTMENHSRLFSRFKSVHRPKAPYPKYIWAKSSNFFDV